MLTRKDYKAIAGIMFRNQRNTIVEGDTEKPRGLLVDMADYMVQDNPRFDRDKFIAACYGEK